MIPCNMSLAVLCFISTQDEKTQVKNFASIRKGYDIYK